MTKYMLSSGNLHHSLEVWETQYDVELSLRSAELELPVYTMRLSDMFTYSSGKPWMSRIIPLEDIQIVHDEAQDKVVISGTMEHLAVSLELSFDANDLLHMT